MAVAFVALVACHGPRRSAYHASPALRIDFIDQQLDHGVAQLKMLLDRVPGQEMPRTFEAGKHVNSGTEWWTSGFVPGSLLYLYEYSGDDTLLALAKQRLDLLEKEKFNTDTHDLGFMLYCSFGNALRITGDTAAYKDILLTGAESLMSRYNPVVRAIRSWDWGAFPVIIDNMMNLEYLLNATRLSGDSAFAKVAIAHAKTTMENHYRPAHSCYHVVDYDPADGKVVRKRTDQGAYDESVWARGQAWGLYGYVMMYRETGDGTYLEFARKIADFIFGHPNMPTDLIPYWDFDAPDLPADSPYAARRELRDASTAAILASALIELAHFTDGTDRSGHLSRAEVILQGLSEPPYKARIGDNGGFILQHSVGSIPHGSEVDVPLTYADYYYIEALVRYRRLLKRIG